MLDNPNQNVDYHTNSDTPAASPAIEGSSTRYCRHNSKYSRNQFNGRVNSEEGDPNLDELLNDVWKTYFRFIQQDVQRLMVVLKMPDPIKGCNRIKQDGLCMLLA